MRLRDCVTGLALGLLGGCQPITELPEAAPCIDGPMPEGQVYVGPVSCPGMRFGSSGENRASDYFLGNAWLRVLIRHPQESISALSLGGGTIVDAAPWGYADRLHEVIPIVDGGWLDVDTFEVSEDGITVGGVVRDLPDAPATDWGARREIRWTLDPDSPWIEAEGADGLYIHPAGAGGWALLDDQLIGDSLALIHDGETVVDLGGAIRVQGASRLLIERTRIAGTWQTGGQRISGEAPGAEALLAYADGEVVDRVALLDDGRFDTRVDDDVDTLVAVADGVAPSEAIAPGTDLVLEVGAEGVLNLDLVWPEGVQERPIRVHWAGHDGRDHHVFLGPSGGTLPLGRGVFDLELSGGPVLEPRSLRVEVDGDTALDVALEARMDPGHHVLGALRWQADRSRTWRGTDEDAVLEAMTAGLGWVALTPLDDVPDAFDRPDWRRWIQVRTGTSTGTFHAFPASPNSRQAAHGAVDTRGLSPEEAFSALALTGPYVTVPLDWLDEVQTPLFALPDTPDFVWLPAPGVDGPETAWSSWFSALDRRHAILPAGPRLWVPVDDPEAVARVDVEAGLIRGRHAAGTGEALLELNVEKYQAGDIVPADWWRFPPRAISVDVRMIPEAIDQVALVADGRTVQSWSVDEDTTLTTELGAWSWVVAVGWSTTSEAWVTTGPVWIRPG